MRLCWGHTELMAENSKLREELAKFALLFDRYLSKSEGRPAGSAGLTQRVVPGGTPQGTGAVGMGCRCFTECNDRNCISLSVVQM